MKARLLFPILALIGAALPATADEITIFAAASLKTALDEVAADWSAETGHTTRIAYAASAALARQIEQGAPADVYISAAVEWMDVLERARQIRPDSRRDVVGNVLVLIGHGADRPAVAIDENLDLASLLDGGKLSMGQLDAVAAGQYGKQALEKLGLWASVAGSVVQSDNVRAALALVVLGEAPVGIVFASDAIAATQSGDPISTLGAFAPETHAPIVYPAAWVAQSDNVLAPGFLDYLTSEPAQAVFAGQGFTRLK